MSVKVADIYLHFDKYLFADNNYNAFDLVQATVLYRLFIIFFFVAS